MEIAAGALLVALAGSGSAFVMMRRRGSRKV
jgi:hypothetical protein